MTWRKSACVTWTLVLVVLFLCPLVYSRPQETVSPISDLSSSTETSIRNDGPVSSDLMKSGENTSVIQEQTNENTSRDVKSKSATINDSIKNVSNQLTETIKNKSSNSTLVIDTRIPPKVKNQLTLKQRIKTRNDDSGNFIETSHAGIAVPVTMEELEQENKINSSNSETSTVSEGISTWILLSNPGNKDNENASTEPTKVEETVKPKPTNKNKPKRPQSKPSVSKRPIIGSTNKSDLVAGGSAISENVYNKIKDTVLSNVKKNKNSPPRSTTVSTTTMLVATEPATKKDEIIQASSKKDSVTKPSTTVAPVGKVKSKPAKKKDKNKTKTTTKLVPNVSVSAMLPMEAKEQEIELEVSTPPTTTKKPKRTSTRKKTKTKKRKTSKPKPEVTTSTAISSELKTANKTKSTKTSKKPTTETGPFTSQIYNYFSREVMPSVGVGVIGLAGLVGLASYFLYPFATPVRRTFEVDKKDDIYKNNAEEYANEGNGQPEEEMLGTVLAGMPAHAKHKLNPYAGQTTYTSRYPIKKEQQDLRYRHVATKYEPNYNAHYPQQKTGIAHGAVYPDSYNYHHRQPQYETRNAYTTSYPAAEPIFAVPQTAPSEISSYGSDSSSSVVYGVKPSPDTDFKPVYPYETQYYGETTSSSATYPPQTSMYLGSNSEPEHLENDKYIEESSVEGDSEDNKFVVGNVPKELSDSETPAVVPEHGPRNLHRKRRNTSRNKRSIVGSIEEILKAASEKEKDIFLSNEIDEALGTTVNMHPSIVTSTTEKNIKMVDPVYAIPMNLKDTIRDNTNDTRNEIIESVSTVPVNEDKIVKYTKTEMLNDVDSTTKSFKVYEVFTTTEKSNVKTNNYETIKSEITSAGNPSTETTTEHKLDTTSTMPTLIDTTSKQSNPTYFPEIITYPPPSNIGYGFFDFIKRMVDFKYRLGLSILQSTSESLNRYLRSMEDSIQRAAKASH
ncbi:uncharacterized protein LOC126966695 [Leptidea sinapis]|uniref:uncharacterized protein LOC126966695 n=1 Tax=Leptidea sinapis TaxID=189913 RepID=UPI0021225088|nr:uncharacterized protein LOC126966695 [Leptidea sinapis]XP_050666847.1 uncharacterized protein LOC126966695 [Leptidea sinapis]